MKLIIFRHGETDANKMNLLQTSTDSELNETGIEQAKMLGKQLEAKNIPIIYSSPLKRTLKTARFVAEANSSEIVIVEDLHEINVGPYENMNIDEFVARYKTLWGRSMDEYNPALIFEKIEGIESRQEMIVRWENSLKIIKNNKLYDEVGVCTHGGMMSVIWYWYYKKLRYSFENCEYFEIDV